MAGFTKKHRPENIKTIANIFLLDTDLQFITKRRSVKNELIAKERFIENVEMNIFINENIINKASCSDCITCGFYIRISLCDFYVFYNFYVLNLFYLIILKNR